MPALLPTPSRHALQLARAAALLLVSTTLLAQGSGSAPARPRAAPAPSTTRAAPPPPPCLVAAFRHLALNTHDPAARALAAEEWLSARASTCTVEQLIIIANNQVQWLGTASTPKLNLLIDGAVETQMLKAQGSVAGMYASRGAPPRATSDSAADGAAPAAASTSTPPQAAAPMPPVPGALPPGSPGAPATVLGAALPGSLPSGVPVAPAVGVAPPATPVAAAPAPTPAAPEAPAPAPCTQLSFFTDNARRAIDDHFFKTLRPGECPSGTQAQAGQCLAVGSNGQWKMCEPLPKGATPNDLPADLLTKLGKPPGAAVVARVGADVLLLDKAGGRVVDAVRNLGRIAPPPDKPVAEVFSADEKARVAAWFKANFAPGKCPSGLALRGTACEDPAAAEGPRWLMGKPLMPDRIAEVLFDPAKAVTAPNAPKPGAVDAKKAEAFKIAKPGYRVVRVGTDILAVAAAAKPEEAIVVDAILKLGAP